jgi:signal transduction histidine kinase
LQEQAVVPSQDEIGQLALALNELGKQLQKTESLRKELIANVSHELRSPLTVIQGYAETVRDVTWSQQQKREEQLTIISDEAARLGRIVEDILDYSKLQAGVTTVHPSDFPLCTALEQAIKRHELDSSARGLSLKLQCTDKTVSFDKDKFGQVMDNLINNALSHATTGGEVTVNAEDHGDLCRISVANYGPTIAAEELPHIWERYYQTRSVSDGKRLGTGLGLAIVKNILDKHGYPYGVTSNNGLTIFWFQVKIIDM